MKLDNLIRDMIEIKTTDIYIKENEPIYYRAMDKVEISSLKANEETIEDIRNYIIKNEISFKGDSKHTSKKKDIYGDYSFLLHCKIRANIFKSSGKDCAVLRLIHSNSLEFEKLGVDKRLVTLLTENRGFSLVCGKTASGKSTTVAALIDYLLKNFKIHIVTLEDPIEYEFNNSKGIVNQRELSSDFSSYNEALKSALRQSPDFIFIGEIRDRETLETALMASESGIGVITTFHSFGAMQTLTKIKSFFNHEEEVRILEMLSNELNFIQSQKLIYIDNNKDLKMDYELMINNKAISTLIKKGNFNEIGNQIILSKKEGMKAL